MVVCTTVQTYIYNVQT
jgi:intraflagellar transport protein 80